MSLEVSVDSLYVKFRVTDQKLRIKQNRDRNRAYLLPDTENCLNCVKTVGFLLLQLNLL